MTQGSEFETAIVNLAKTFGYLVMHSRVMQDKRGVWRTPLQGHPGFPDLVIVGHGRVLFRELKTGNATLEPKQKVWRDELVAAGADYAVWRPTDLAAIEADLGKWRTAA